MNVYKAIGVSGAFMSATSLSRRRFLGTLASLAAATAIEPRWFQAGAQTVRRPNIICILADDVGLDDVSYTGGNQCPTPHIDALARTGTQFQYCYSSPQCGPSRAELLTGRYPFRTGMVENSLGNVMKPSREIMIPRVLKAAGYVSASVGKWSQMPLQPSDWGFDEYFRFHGSGGYWSYDKRGESYVINGKTYKTPANVYLPDLMHQFAVDFVTRHQNQPFFLYYPLSHVHAPILPTPDSAPNSSNLYADNIAYMDKLVGKLVETLDKLGLRENTLILFVGDNGTAPQFARRGKVDGKLISGEKHTMLEGGSRVPLVVNWKGTTPAGKECSDLTDFSDFLPTFAQLAGAPLPGRVKIDGHSFAPQIKGEKGTPREWVYVELEDARYVATKKWKLNNDGILYDMSRAPFNETPILANADTPQSAAARAHLQQILVGLVGQKLAFSPSEALGMKVGPRGRKRGAMDD